MEPSSSLHVLPERLENGLHPRNTSAVSRVFTAAVFTITESWADSNVQHKNVYNNRTTSTQREHYSAVKMNEVGLCV